MPSIMNDVIGAGKNRLIIDTAQLESGKYETITMKPGGYEVDSRATWHLEEARDNHALFLRRFRAEENKYWPAKMYKLVTALREARVAAYAHDSDPDDGTCNFDAPAVDLPRWREADVEACAEAAGLRCHGWTLFGGKMWVFSVLVAGQANRRTHAAEAMTKVLNDHGFTALTYYQMD